MSLVAFFTAIDSTVHEWFLTIHSESLTLFFSFITLFGEWKILFPSLFCASVLLYVRSKKRFITYIIPLWLALLCASATTYALKLLIARPRPLPSLALESSFSFPSAHATLAMAMYGYLLFVAVQQTRSTWVQHSLVCFGACLILVIGVSRLYLGVHYVSDVLVGFIIGYLSIVLSTHFYTKHLSR